jgi:hypothetical protein
MDDNRDAPMIVSWRRYLKKGATTKVISNLPTPAAVAFPAGERSPSRDLAHSGYRVDFLDHQKFAKGFG